MFWIAQARTVGRDHRIQATAVASLECQTEASGDEFDVSDVMAESRIEDVLAQVDPR